MRYVVQESLVRKCVMRDIDFFLVRFAVACGGPRNL